MNIQQRFEAIQAIKKYATIRGKYHDDQNGFCAMGALLYVTNGLNFPWVPGLFSKTLEKFGLNPLITDELVHINDTFEDPLVRRERLINYLESLPLTQ